MLKKSAVILLLILAVSSMAAEAKSAFARSQEMLKVKDPAAWAEIQKLAATDMDAAVKKMQAAAAKHKISLVFSTITVTAGSNSSMDNRRNRGGMRNGGDFGGMRNGGDFGGRRSNRRGGNMRGGNMRGGNMRGGNMRGGNMRGGNMRGGNMMMMGFFSRIMAENAIRAKFPAEVDALNKVLMDAEVKYAELAKKAGVEFSESTDNKMRRLQTAAGAEMTELLAAVKNNDFSAVQKLFALAKKHNISLMPARNGRGSRSSSADGEARPAGGRQVGPNMSRLRRSYPEDMKKYDELRRKDPAAARKILVGLIKRDSAKK